MPPYYIFKTCKLISADRTFWHASFPVAIPISAPIPNSPPSANWVDAFVITIALSTSAKNRSARFLFCVMMDSVWPELYLLICSIAVSKFSTIFIDKIASKYSVDQSPHLPS